MKIGITSPCDLSVFYSFFSNENKKILKRNHYTNCAPAVNTLILSFLNRGYFVRIFTLANENFFVKGDQIEIYGVKNYDRYPIKFLWGSFITARHIKKVIKNNILDLDVLHGHWTYACTYAALAYTKQIPVFCTVRDWTSYIWTIESLKNKITWSFLYLMNELVFKNKEIHFIANSPYTHARIKKKYKLDVPIISNPIKQTFITDKEHFSPDNLEILCISSSNDKRKNIITLLHAFQILLKKYDNARLSLIGPPFNDDQPIIQNWKNKGLLINVHLIGEVNHDKLKDYLDKTTLFVTPSLEETFGNTLLEAMARKVPIVAGQNSGAVPYVLDDGKAGYLCNVNNAEEIAENIDYIYTNKEECKQKVEHAFNRVKSLYLDDSITQQHIKLYSKNV